MAEMDSITRDALKRAQQMQSHINSRNSRAKQVQSSPSKESPVPPYDIASSKEAGKNTPEKIFNGKAEQTNHTESSASGEGSPERLESMLDLLMGNKEQSLILLLIILLMDEKCEPSLLLALMYLLL